MLILKAWFNRARFQADRRDKEQYVLYQQALDMGVHDTHTRLLGGTPNTLLAVHILEFIKMVVIA